MTFFLRLSVTKNALHSAILRRSTNLKHCIYVDIIDRNVNYLLRKQPHQPPVVRLYFAQCY